MKKQKEIEAVYNAGRWMVYCLIHGKDGAVLALDYHKDDPTQSKLWAVDGEYICPVCYPGIVAEMVVVQDKKVKRIPDRSAQATARLLARTNDHIYKVTFPEGKKLNRDLIEKVLENRPVLKRNWDGRHETIAFLERENHIMENFKKRKNMQTPDELGVTVVRKKRKRVKS